MIYDQTSLWKPSEDGKVCVPAEQNISKRHLHLLSALLDNMFWSSGGRLLQGRMNKNMVINEADGESWQDGTQVIVFFD